MNKKRWDIFCKIVDNFGDIGVCWRLAQQLQYEHGLNVRLWVDDLSAAQKIISTLNVQLNQQIIDEICVLSWHANADFSDVADVADVVIEAFACELPAAYLNAMAQKKSTWINLEYLSAETWVGDFHAKPSPRPDLGLTRYFYFPGFTEATGSLIREKYIVDKNQQVASDCNEKNWLCKSVNLTNHNQFKVSLFCYPNAPIESLLTAMAESNQPINCYVPESSILPQIALFFGKKTVKVNHILQLKNLNLHVLPFLSQLEYDQLLSACDINFVRGEDSWLRAIWAGKPFIWQPYFQDENTHIKKLNAFLDLFYASLDTKEVVLKMHSDWVAAQLSANIWQCYLKQLPDIADYTLQQSQQLAKQTDLAAKLVHFCNKL